MATATSPSGEVRRRARRRPTLALFLGPSVAILAIFVFVPLVASLVLSVMNIDIFMKDVSFAGLANFRRLLADERVWRDTANTFYFAVLAVPLQVVVALAVSALVSRDTKWNRALRSIYYVPFVCSMVAISIVWSMLLDPNMGLLPFVLRHIGLGSVAFLKDPNLAMPTIVVITAWKAFGYLVTILTAAILNVPASLHEAAQIDGASTVGRFVRITIPQIWPTITFVIVTTTIGALQVFDQAYVMTRGGPNGRTETLVQYIYNRGFQIAPFDLGYASSIAVFLFFIIAVLTFVLRRFILDRGEDES